MAFEITDIITKWYYCRIEKRKVLLVFLTMPVEVGTKPGIYIQLCREMVAIIEGNMDPEYFTEPMKDAKPS